MKWYSHRLHHRRPTSRGPAIGLSAGPAPLAGVIIDLTNPFNLNEALRRQALRVLRIHSLRSAASLQLAAAIEWAGAPKEGEPVAFDERLKAAARREGFEVL